MSHFDVGAMKMDDQHPSYDLSALAPAIEPGEALSSWLVRLAQAHLLTVTELQEAIGHPLTAFERGHTAGLPRVIAMTGFDPANDIALPDLLANPIPPGPRPPDGWAVCRHCLEEDIRQGRAPHIRLSWTHPLAVWCDIHNCALVPHANSSVKIADSMCLHGDRKKLATERQDALLEFTDFNDPATLARVKTSQANEEGAFCLRHAVGDVAAALAVTRSSPNSGSLMSLFERPIFHRKSMPGTTRLQPDRWAELNAPRRLLFVRVALFVLAEPLDPVTGRRDSPLGSDWLLLRYRHHKAPGWQAVFSHAARDPLLVLATELPRDNHRTQ